MQQQIHDGDKVTGLLPGYPAATTLSEVFVFCIPCIIVAPNDSLHMSSTLVL